MVHLESTCGSYKEELRLIYILTIVCEMAIAFSQEKYRMKNVCALCEFCVEWRSTNTT